MTELGRTCDGACCAVFYLPLSIEAIRAGGMETYVDGPYIADMVIPLTLEEARARRERFGIPPAEEAAEVGVNQFTCRHWDETTRLCGAYDARPTMCRDYPYGKPCDRRSCGYQVADDVAAKYPDPAP